MQSEKNKKVVWLIGAHKGENAIPFAKKGGGYKVYCLEANPKLLPFLKPLNDNKNVEIAALVEPSFSEHSVSFFLSDEKTEWGTTKEDWVRTGQRYTEFTSIESKAITLTEIIQRWERPDVVIVDIEGSDLEAFILPMNKHLKYFDKTLFSLECSKRNYTEILDSLSKSHHFFSIIVNCEFNPISIAKLPKESELTINTTSIGSILYEVAQGNKEIRRFTAQETFDILDLWFSSKNIRWTFNFEAWIDLIVWPSSPESPLFGRGEMGTK
jgi:FkbM family methyltransferase